MSAVPREPKKNDQMPRSVKFDQTATYMSCRSRQSTRTTDPDHVLVTGSARCQRHNSCY